jgi:transposase-like protein
MNLIQIYKKFPTSLDCIKHLENVRWKGKPTCPYCKSTNQSPLKNTNRYHCNTCNTSFSVTVGTIFHKTKCDLQKWFLAITLVLNAKKGISARQLARDIEVTKDTAWFMLMRIRKAFAEYGDLLTGIVEADETYIGGKNKNRHFDKKVPHAQGRNSKDKVTVFGMVERGGKVKAQTVKDAKKNTLQRIVKRSVEKGANLMTDEWRSYRGLSTKYIHSIVCHNRGQYVDGVKHTNTIESFWSLLKRGIIGQYHYVTERYLNQYINEFCFRYNNRGNSLMFDLTLEKAVA